MEDIYLETPEAVASPFTRSPPLSCVLKMLGLEGLIGRGRKMRSGLPSLRAEVILACAENIQSSTKLVIGVKYQRRKQSRLRLQLPSQGPFINPDQLNKRQELDGGLIVSVLRILRFSIISYSESLSSIQVFGRILSSFDSTNHITPARVFISNFDSSKILTF